MSLMRPADVGACGLASLGRKLDAVPGVRHKMMAFIMSRMMYQGMAGDQTPHRCTNHRLQACSYKNPGRMLHATRLF